MRALLAPVVLLGLLSSQALGDDILKIQFGTPINTTSTGGEFDITLMNTSQSTLTIAAFQLYLQSMTQSIVFNSITNGTAIPYIFPANVSSDPSENNIGMAANNMVNGQPAYVASDFDGADEPGITLGAGEIVGLGHVSFSFANANHPTFDAVLVTDTSYTRIIAPDPGGDPSGSNIAGSITDNGGGTYTVTAADSESVPEPGPLALMVVGGVVVGGYWKCKRRRMACAA